MSIQAVDLDAHARVGDSEGREGSHRLRRLAHGKQTRGQRQV